MEALFYIKAISQEFKFKKSVPNLPKIGHVEDISLSYLLRVISCPEHFLMFSKSGLSYGKYRVIKVKRGNKEKLPEVVLEKKKNCACK